MSLLSNRHLWVISALLLLLSLLQYAGPTGLANESLMDSTFWLVLVSLGRILFLGPVIYATLKIGTAGGLAAALIAFTVSLSSAFLNSGSLVDALLEVIGVLSMGLFFNFWYWAQIKEKKKAALTLAELDSAHRELKQNVNALMSSEKRFSSLNVVWSTLFGSLELKTLYEKTTRMVADLMYSQVAVLFVDYDSSGKMISTAHVGLTDKLAAILETVNVDEGPFGEAALKSEPVIVRVVSAEKDIYRTAFLEAQIQTLLVVPLVLKGHTDGLIAVGRSEVRDYKTEDAELLMTIGKQIIIAIENARLYEKQKETSHRLAVSEANYRRLLEHASDAIWAHDMDGRIVAANRAAGELAGFTSAEEMIGRDVRESLDWKGLTMARNVRRNLLENIPFQQPYEQRLVRIDGSEIILMISSSLVKNDEEHQVFEHVARDVTRERRMQDNLRYYVQQITRTQEEERNRIARDLHDDTAQALYALTRQIDNYIRNSGTSLTPGIIDFLQKLEEQTRSALQGVRRFSQNLRPPMLDDLGLMATLRWLVRDMQQRCNLKTSLVVEGPERRLPSHVELTVFRVVQEALTNVEKHAQASTLDVKISFKEDGLDILIRDDGKGFELKEELTDLPRAGRLGLVGMDERVRLIGGTLNISSEINKGTLISVRVPV
ncbi:MAG: PAS domain S-box protein [Dehalococcoidales bacterium]|nr:PAS domain S-box protein [Dehalococcoidales bacterium]